MTGRFSRRTVLAAALTPIAVATTGSRVRAQDDVQALLSKAATSMASLSSFHFEMETIDGRATIFENLEVNKVVGDVLRPDSFQATITAKLAVVEIDVQIVATEGAVWVTDPLQGGWRQVASAGTSDAAAFTALVNPDQLFLRALELIEEPTIEGNERIGDVDTTVVSGMFDPTRIANLATPEAGTPSPEGDENEGELDAASFLATEPVYLTAWIDAEGLVHLIEEEGPLTSSESNDVIRAISFSAFDEPVEILPPENV